MCGIAGLMATSALSPDSGGLVRLRDSMVHRGPDGFGSFIDRNVALLHRRLSIIDLEGGIQPLVSADGRYAVTYNGEIYNYLELRNELVQLGHSFATQSDTEVLLNAYIQYGEACLDRLEGMFAFVIYDKQKQSFFGARDRLGIKPLYYARLTDSFVFASEIKAIVEYRRTLGVSPAADMQSMSDYLTFQFQISHRTLFKNIFRLMPGHSFHYRSGVMEIKEYWRLDKVSSSSPVRNRTDWMEELQSKIKAAVTSHLRSDVPVGCYLSGGIDSSTILGVATKVSGQSLKTFCAGFSEGGIYDDSAFAKISARANASEHFEVFPNQDDFRRLLKKLIWHMDEPMAGEGMFPQYIVSSLAARHVKVVLGGQGADEIFGGYIRYLALHLDHLLDGTIHPAKKLCSGLSLNDISSVMPQLAGYQPLLQKLMADGMFQSWDKRYLRVVTQSHNLSNDISESFVRELGGYSSNDEYLRLINDTRFESLLDRMLYADMRTSLGGLLHVEDRMSMAASVESRVPFLDHRLVEFAFQIPDADKFLGGQTKSLLRDAVAPWVPAEVAQRKEKLGFPVPLNAWARSGLYDFVYGILKSDRAQGRGWYKSDYIDRILTNSSGGAFDRRLWGALCLELWAEVFLDGDSV
jgi:asparagine synthase (glutamine-hydrolysing)